MIIFLFRKYETYFSNFFILSCFLQVDQFWNGL